MNEVTGYYSTSWGLNSNTVVNIAIKSAEAAVSLSNQQRVEQQRQATFAQQQQMPHNPVWKFRDHAIQAILRATADWPIENLGKAVTYLPSYRSP